MNRVTQIASVKEDLMSGHTITQLDAYSRYKSTRLAAIIWVLRHKHLLPIQSKRMTAVESGKQFAAYFINTDDIELIKEVGAHKLYELSHQTTAGVADNADLSNAKDYKMSSAEKYVRLNDVVDIIRQIVADSTASYIEKELKKLPTRRMKTDDKH